MGTTDVRLTLSDEEHSELHEKKGDATWRDALRVGCEELAKARGEGE